MTATAECRLGSVGHDSNSAGGFANPWQGYPGGNPFPIVLNKNVPFPTGGKLPDCAAESPHHVSGTVESRDSAARFGKDWLLSASYLGNNTIHLWSGVSLDPSVYIPGQLCQPDSTA